MGDALPACAVHVWKGEAAITLRANAYEATFLPGCGMLCASLRHDGEELVAWPRTLTAFRRGDMTAMPVVHPWGNRLARWGYRAGGRRVDLRGLDLPVDNHGLPMHGNLLGAPFAVLRVEPGHLRAALDFATRPDLLRAFPFPHVLAIDVLLDRRGMRVRTEVTPTGARPVPVSFCWHPYLRVPGARREWVLRWPACEHVEVDDRVIPTGARTLQPAQQAPLASRTFDDHYALGSDRRFSVSGGNRTLELSFDRAYAFAQLYVPPRGEFMAIEPMTARIDALGHDDAPVCAPGETFAATFTLRVRRT